MPGFMTGYSQALLKSHKDHPTTGLFNSPPRYKGLAEIVKISSPSEATNSTKTLLSEFHSASTRAKKVRIKRATVQAANRAGASAKKHNISSTERAEMKKVEQIYRDAVEQMELD